MFLIVMVVWLSVLKKCFLKIENRFVFWEKILFEGSGWVKYEVGNMLYNLFIKLKEGLMILWWFLWKKLFYFEDEWFESLGGWSWVSCVRSLWGYYMWKYFICFCECYRKVRKICFVWKMVWFWENFVVRSEIYKMFVDVGKISEWS